MEGALTEISSNFDDILYQYLPDIFFELGDEKESNSRAKNACDYFTWAYMNVIPLSGTDNNLKAYLDFATNICPAQYYNKVT